MSAFRSLFSRSIRSSKKKKASPAVVAAGAPWIRNGIDYGPARAAIQDLATWALDIADRAVADWPAGRAHVKRTRRYVDARIAGNAPRQVAIDDVMFTAQLLARIFDDDLGLGISDMLTIFDLLELPNEVVPVSTPRTQHVASNPLVALFRNAEALTAVLETAPPSLRLCVDCGYVHEPGDHVHYRNVA
jgi:hypothetical protein